MAEQTLQLFASVLVISILHGILPNHWLPVVAISRRMGWTVGKTAGVTLIAALAHSSSTVLIGLLLAFGGMTLGHILPYFRFIAAALLILLGIVFIWRHQHHMHFHLREINLASEMGMGYIMGTLLLAMFLSPCLEVGPLFIMSGTISLRVAFMIAIVYTVTSAIGMTTFSWLAMKGLQRLDWHKLEHSSGLISGIVLLLSGILFFLIS